MDSNNYQRSIGLVEADVEANCKKHGVRGILEHADIMKIISEYSDEDKQARIFGKFQHLTGLVFKEFKRNIHVIKPFDINPRDYVVVEALDTHTRNEDAVVWMAIDRYGRKIVIDEIYEHYTTSELAAKIKHKSQNYRVVKRVIDPSADIVDQHSGRSLKSDLYNMGLDYDLGSKQRHRATQLIKDELHYTISGNQILKAPTLYFFSSCTRSIWEMEHWQYGEWTGKTAQTRSPNEKPVDKDDHCIEDIGRCLLTDTHFSPMIEEVQNYGTQFVDDTAPAISPATVDPYA